MTRLIFVSGGEYASTRVVVDPFPFPFPTEETGDVDWVAHGGSCAITIGCRDAVPVYLERRGICMPQIRVAGDVVSRQRRWYSPFIPAPQLVQVCCSVSLLDSGSSSHIRVITLKAKARARTCFSLKANRHCTDVTVTDAGRRWRRRRTAHGARRTTHHARPHRPGQGRRRTRCDVWVVPVVPV
jgi:hypothetical protein